MDDGSTDGTSDWLTSQTEIIKISHRNHGVAASRNRGLERATGEWIALLDSDDLWLPKKLETQLNFLKKNPEIRICQTEEIWERNGVRVNPKEKHKKYSGWIFEHCIPLCIISPSAVMIHRDIFKEVGSFDESFPVCEDYELWLRVALHYSVVTLSEPLIIKRGGHEDQLSKKWGQDYHRIRALQKILKDPKLAPHQRELVLKDIERRTQILKKGASKRGVESPFYSIVDSPPLE